MSQKDPKLVVLLFNECINSQDIDGLARLMSEDHVFVDSSDERHAGKEAMVVGWADFFASYPDYRNHFQRIESRGDRVLIAGYSTCSVPALDGPALWSARVRDDRLTEWRVYLDTPANRRQLGIT